MKRVAQIGKASASGRRRKSVYEGDDYRFYRNSCLNMPQCEDNSIALTVTSPPYWNAVDYDIHARSDADAWHREREYVEFGKTYKEWLKNIKKAFSEVYRVTIDGGFCAVVIGTILHNKKHYPAPFDLMKELEDCGWLFHQDIIWNKVTGGVKRAGVYIQHPRQGYYYPNIMTEYILVFRKGEKTRRDRRKALPVDEVFKRDIANNIWHIAPVPPRTVEHPCPYPDELARRLVLLYSQKGDEVLDPFMGSGTTARMALQNGRLCVGYDIEDSYLRYACKRLLDKPARKYNLLPRVEKRAAI